MEAVSLLLRELRAGLEAEPRLQGAVASIHFHEAAFGLQDTDSVLTWFCTKMKADSCSRPAKGQLHRAGWASALTRASVAFE